MKNADKQIIKTYGIDEYFLNIYIINTLYKKDIKWIKENMYFDYFLNNLINYNSYQELVKLYMVDIINIIKYNKLNSYKSIDEIKLILSNIFDINSKEYIELKNIFFLNYFDFCKKYKKITLKYYDDFYFIFNEIYIDEFINNDFEGFSWYFAKNWNLFPPYITSKIKFTFIDI